MEREILKLGLGVAISGLGWLVKRFARRLDILSARQRATNHELEKVKRAVNILEAEIGRPTTVFN